MEHSVEKQFTSEIMNKILSTYHLDTNFKKLGDFENYAFEVNHEGEAKILRVTHSSHRTQKELESELDWIQYLHGCGINIPAVFLSPNGNTVEAFQAEDSVFYASLFEKARGNPVKLVDFNEKLFRIWGKVIGKMHNFTKSYQPGENIQPRYQWDENDLLRLEYYYPESDKAALKAARNVVAEIEKLPKTKDSYGLIHTDIHAGNFFYDGDAIHIFDFDDASYHFFASDIAIPLYYSLISKHLYGTREERNEFAREFMQAFLEGYREENELSQECIETISLFLKLRDVDLYSVFSKKVPAEERTERMQHWIAEIKERIEKNEAIVDLDLISNII
ncbi:phosphotransferase enzyme family protein [Lederbergia wuyishanensis]|uniref:Ser/Thr protein kinase RdoA (MazF antagonist) n=1 Tax=Lederbergia wuyishanensis TaxID=1347903 RepID=A0ABU0DAX3_9BACI|nr:phosphotransferase [Lederbergia wuyishanensis]MCJ8010057.1 phosphotransferase [Lederbergia wuyishanensis]MDQ0345571.1 Ser/Thr protein kinase RdoA (MazF antagonist) [Lederbergia wuyishanensis]